MIYYLLILFACILIAFQFSANKIYQKNTSNNKSNVVLYPAIAGGFSLIIFVTYGLITGDFVSGFFASLKTLSFWLALALALLNILSILLGVVTVKYGALAIYSVFMMLGSMIVTTVFGIAVWGESAGVLKILGIIVLGVSIVLPVTGTGEKMNFKFTLLCICAGLVNGFYTVVSVWHSKMIGTDKVTNVNSFMNWQYLLMAIICLTAFIVMKFILKTDVNEDACVEEDVDCKKSKVPFFKNLVFIMFFSAFMYAGSSGIGYLLQLIALEKLPATVVTPLVSGLAIVCSAGAGLLFFKEKPSLKSLIAIGVTIVGVTLIMIDGLLIV